LQPILGFLCCDKTYVLVIRRAKSPQIILTHRDPPGGLRHTSHKGSLPLLYGIDGLIPKAHPALLVVEGEINQLSILQVLCEHEQSRPGSSLVSTGSEGLNPKQAALLRWAARHFEMVVFWMD